jgi:hypothetical protein
VFWVLARGAALPEAAVWGAAIMKGGQGLGMGPGGIATDAALRVQELERDRRNARLLAHAAGAAPGVLAREAGNVAATVYQSVAPAVVQFRRGGLPRVTGLEGLPSMQELIADFVAGARVPVGSVFPPPWEPNGVLKFLGLGLAVLARQAWGLANSRPEKTPIGPGAAVGAWPTGTFDPGGWNSWSWEATGERLDYPDCATYLPARTATRWYPTPPGQVMWLEEKPRPVGACGVPDLLDGWIYTSGAMGETTGGSGLTDFLRTSGWTSAAVTARVRAVAEVGAQPFPAQPAAVPDGWTPGWAPKWEPTAPSPAPQPTLPAPVPLPAEVPGTEQPPDVSSPGVKPSAVPAVNPTLPALTPAAPAVGRPIRPDGVVAPAPVQRPGTTPVDQEIPWPGGQPIGSPGQQPRPSLEGIAQEVGRIERKLAQMNTVSRPPAGQGPGGLSDLIGPLWDLLMGLTDQGSYAISSECVPDGEPGSPGQPLERAWGGSFGRFGALEKRMDALAGLLQDHKTLPARTCRKPIPTGEWVTVNFESEDVSPLSHSRLRKVLRYLDRNSGSLEAHVDHWRGFEWDAGPWIVIHKGAAWGVPQVWAASAEEGKRVLRHAGAIAGVDTEQAPGEWVVQRSSSPRYGIPGRMGVRRGRDRIWMVSKREGPSGPGEYLRPG